MHAPERTAPRAPGIDTETLPELRRHPSILASRLLHTLTAVRGTEPPCHSHKEARPFVRGKRELAALAALLVTRRTFLASAAYAHLADAGLSQVDPLRNSAAKCPGFRRFCRRSAVPNSLMSNKDSAVAESTQLVPAWSYGLSVSWLYRPMQRGNKNTGDRPLYSISSSARASSGGGTVRGTKA